MVGTAYVNGYRIKKIYKNIATVCVQYLLIAIAEKDGPLRRGICQSSWQIAGQIGGPFIHPGLFIYFNEAHVAATAMKVIKVLVPEPHMKLSFI